MDFITVYITQYWNHLGIWFTSGLFTLSHFIQVCIIITLYFLAKFFARYSSDYARHIFANTKLHSFYRLRLSGKEFFYLFYFVTLLWISVLIARTSDLPFDILRVAVSLANAWAIIRLLTGTIKSKFISGLMSKTLWIVAALNVIGLLDDTIKLLENASFMVGGAKISLLLIIKTLITFGILFWIVQFVSNGLKRKFHNIKELNPSQQVLLYKIVNIILFTGATLWGLNFLGMDLTALTIFSGAIGLSIGFGLQKIFSNLISGLILLFDKSIKPGDIIAIGTTFGRVNSLGARCVSLLTLDGREHLIPNENLITGNVENWSYSDTKVGFNIPIGVSYKSDLKLVKNLLIQAVTEHPRIQTFPAPNCFLTAFADNSVNFEISVWITDPENGMKGIKSDVYFKIWELFSEHHIEIPFPQRDFNVKMETLQEIKESLSL